MACLQVVYVIACKSENFGQFFTLKVGGSTYIQVSTFAISHCCDSKLSEL